MEKSVKSICPYCGVGCGLAVTVRAGRVVQVRGDKDHPSTLGHLCPKGALGTNNIDANSRLCMASAVSAYKMAFGSDGPPACYEDIDLAECFLIVGANMAECHPVLWQRIKKRAGRKRVRIIVVDPRRTPPPRRRICTWPSGPAPTWRC